MKNQVIFTICLLLITQLSGCVSSTQQLTGVASEPANNQQLSKLNQWQLTGKLGYKTEKKAQSINLFWQQQFNNYQLRLSGPVGFGTATLSGNQQQVKIQQGSETITGAPDQLGMQLIGLPLSVTAMSWWIKGLTSPNHPQASNIVISDDGQINSFEQNGWQLTFSQHSITGPYKLPKKITGRRGDTSFKLVISSWKPSHYIADQKNIK